MLRRSSLVCVLAVLCATWAGSADAAGPEPVDCKILPKRRALGAFRCPRTSTEWSKADVEGALAAYRKGLDFARAALARPGAGAVRPVDAFPSSASGARC